MIAVRLAGGFFKPRLLPTLLTILMLPALVALGAWQVERLHWKENLIETMALRMGQEPIDATAIDGLTSADYLAVRAHGHYLADHNLYLTAISIKGQGGYDLITPFILDSGATVFVNRGWIPYEGRGSSLGAAVSEDVIDLQGIVRVPKHRWLEPANHPERSEWFTVDPYAMGSAFQLSPVKPFYIVAAAAAPGSYPEGGQIQLDLPNNHLSYAITWFGLAAALLIIYGVSSWVRDAEKPKS